MVKTLRVINPFFVMELGDTFEFDEDSQMYRSVHKENFYKVDDSSVNEVTSTYHSEFSISPEYAKTLINEGYLEPVSPAEKGAAFVNIFDEIDKLLAKYKKSLQTIDEDNENIPACVKVEKQAVFTNLVTLLEHLKSLKK